MAAPRAHAQVSPSGDAPGGRVVVVGASAGGFEALTTLLAGLPPDFPAAMCIVLHTSPSGRGRMAAVLGRHSTLPVALAEDGATMRAGHIYMAPPDHHLVLEAGVIRLTRGPRENRQRPAVDALFRSAAYVYGPQVIGVVLTGALDDGTAGLWTVKDRGGVAVAQDPDEALFPWMPQSAIEYVDVDHVAPLQAIGPLLARLVGQASSTHEGRTVSRELAMTTQIAKGDSPMDLGLLTHASPSPFTCPECAGVLVRMREGGVPTFRCHTGHAYSLDSLTAATTEHAEDVMTSALRSLDEVQMLLTHSAEHVRARGDEAAARAIAAQAEATRQRGEALRALLQEQRTLSRETLLSDDGHAGGGGAPAPHRGREVS